MPKVNITRAQVSSEPFLDLSLPIPKTHKPPSVAPKDRSSSKKAEGVRVNQGGISSSSVSGISKKQQKKGAKGSAAEKGGNDSSTAADKKESGKKDESNGAGAPLADNKRAIPLKVRRAVVWLVC